MAAPPFWLVFAGKSPLFFPFNLSTERGTSESLAPPPSPLFFFSPENGGSVERYLTSPPSIRLRLRRTPPPAFPLSFAQARRRGCMEELPVLFSSNLLGRRAQARLCLSFVQPVKWFPPPPQKTTTPPPPPPPPPHSPKRN